MDITLVVMAAGLGSRYGGLKQIDPVGESGEILLEYAVYDAIQAGFNKVIFIIKEEMLGDFKEIAGDRLSRHVDISYAFQRLDKLPAGFSLPEGRRKPWGTGQALWAAADAVKTPFCAINADDFYGRDAFERVGRFLQSTDDTEPFACCMAGYSVENTLTENGTVSRGVCKTDERGMLISIVERTKLRREGDWVVDLDSGTRIHPHSPVSLNLWGFPRGAMNLLEGGFAGFLRSDADLQKEEFYLPSFVDAMVQSGKATVSVLPAYSRWYGVTYREDRKPLADAIAAMTEKGVYPRRLFD